MPPQDASSLVVPIQTILVITGLVAGAVVWLFLNFERKSDATLRQNESKEKHDALALRLTAQEATMSKVAQDISYIRGRLEPRE